MIGLVVVVAGLEVETLDVPCDLLLFLRLVVIVVEHNGQQLLEMCLELCHQLRQVEQRGGLEQPLLCCDAQHQWQLQAMRSRRLTWSLGEKGALVLWLDDRWKWYHWIEVPNLQK